MQIKFTNKKKFDKKQKQQQQQKQEVKEKMTARKGDKVSTIKVSELQEGDVITLVIPVRFDKSVSYFKGLGELNNAATIHGLFFTVAGGPLKDEKFDAVATTDTELPILVKTKRPNKFLSGLSKFFFNWG